MKPGTLQQAIGLVVAIVICFGAAGLGEFCGRVECGDLADEQLSRKYNTDPIDALDDYFHCCPQAGYGGSFIQWAMQRRREPYNSWGNGSAMRVSSVAFAYDTLDEGHAACRTDSGCHALSLLDDRLRSVIEEFNQRYRSPEPQDNET